MQSLHEAVHTRLDGVGFEGAVSDSQVADVGETEAAAGDNGNPVLAYQALMKEELGREWLHADLFRIGASTLVTDIERQLHHQSTGQYAADYYMALS